MEKTRCVTEYQNSPRRESEDDEKRKKSNKVENNSRRYFVEKLFCPLVRQQRFQTYARQQLEIIIIRHTEII